MQNESCHRCYEYVQAGDLEGLLRAREEGCRWDQEAGFLSHGDLCLLPTMAGDLVTLQWLRAQGCPEPYWREVVWHAAAWGRSEVVSWACAQGLPISESAPLLAVFNGNLPTLQCLAASGAKWDPVMCLRAANSGGHATVAAWIEWWMSPDEIKEPGEA